MSTLIILLVLGAVGYFYVWPKYKQKKEEEASSQAEEPVTTRDEQGRYVTKFRGKTLISEFDPEGVTGGKGFITFPDGETFEGVWGEAGLLEGVFTFTNGTRYEGPVDNDFLAHGVGTLDIANGDLYKGEMVHGKMEGMGELHLRDKDKNVICVYTGPVHDNKMHGEGEIIYPSGASIQGIWHEDKLQSASIYYDDDRVYAGAVNGYNPHGKGTMTYPDGRIEEGLWDNGNFVG